MYIPYTYWRLLLDIPVFLHNELCYKVTGTGIPWFLGILKSQLSTTVSYHTAFICMWWSQIELKVWIALACQDSIRQSWITGALSQFLLFTGLCERHLLSWANKADPCAGTAFVYSEIWVSFLLLL